VASSKPTDEQRGAVHHVFQLQLARGNAHASQPKGPVSKTVSSRNLSLISTRCDGSSNGCSASVCVSCGAHPSYWLVGVVAHLHVDTDFDSPDRQTERCLARAIDVRKGEASEIAGIDQLGGRRYGGGGDALYPI
jgi:hypothetical protein